MCNIYCPLLLHLYFIIFLFWGLGDQEKVSIASPKWGRGGGGRGSVHPTQVHVLSSPDTSLTSCDASNTTAIPWGEPRVNATLHGDSDVLCGL